MLKVQGLNVELGGEKIIEDLSFEVEEGEVLTILGPNGAGKSTLLKALTGGVSYRGNVMWEEEARISYLPEEVTRENFEVAPVSVKDFFLLQEVEGEEIKEILSKVGLSPEKIERSPASFSSGEFQRMMIGWSLVSDPNVMILDEPAESIDVGGKDTIYSLLHKFWEERGLTIILVTHDLNVVYAHSNNVLCLRRKKLCYGAPETVLTPESLKEIYGQDIKFYKH